jgi:hypothetical protein
VAVDFERQVAGFSRYHKYTLGTDLRNRSRRVVDGRSALSDPPCPIRLDPPKCL